MRIGEIGFDEPCQESGLQDRPGIYVVLDEFHDRHGRVTYYCIDVGESDQVLSRVSTHERARCWDDHIEGLRTFAVLYTDDQDDDSRKHVEEELRSSLSPPCGDR